jgi:hypothetical protein
MAKAIIGAVEIAGGITLLLVAPAALAPFAWGLIMSGAGEELAYVASVLQGNPALTASAKLPSAPREFIYGEVRKGGMFLYQSTTGHQLNQVIAWAAHSCQALIALYIDQRKLYYNYDNLSPWGGGTGDGVTYVDDSDNNYNFGSGVAAWHTKGWLAGASTPAWSSGMPASRNQDAIDNAGSLSPTMIAVPIAGVTYIFGCVADGVAGSSVSVFSAATATGAFVTDGSITWVNCGPSPGGYWFQELNAQDTANWLSNCLMQGIFGTYLKLTYDAGVFNGPPQLRATVQGKNTIYDPRSSTYGYTSNAALCIADMLCDSQFGLSAPFAAVYGGAFGEQLIAAANLCDEQVQLADGSIAGSALPWEAYHPYAATNQFTYGGTTWTVNVSYVSGGYFGQDDYTLGEITQTPGTPGYESRYTINGYGDSNQLPGEIISSMLMACEGRIVRQGGGYYIYPAAWYGTSLNFGANDLCGGVDWSPSRKFRDRINCVRATFVCPQYPYAVAGYSWDYKDPNIFAGEWQPTDAPPYAQDYLHGYGAITDPGGGDANLVQDGLVRLYADRRYQFVTSAATVQRLVKIFLLRNRFQGSGTFPLKLSALQAQAQDVVNFIFAPLAMDGTYLEVAKFDWVLKESAGDKGGQGARAIELSTALKMQLTDPSVYEWSPAEEMTLYDQPSPLIENAFQVTPPTDLVATGSISAALVTPGGQVTPRIELTWIEPADPFTVSGGHIQIEITPHGTGAWVSVLVLAGTAQIAYLSNVVSGLSYDVRIRSVRASGAYSVWVEVDNIVVGAMMSSTGLSPVAPSGTLTATTSSPTDSTIFVGNFLASGGGFTVACTPSPSSIDGETPSQLYFIYYIDPGFAGGTITPIVTQDPVDFENKAGYFLIGSITTPAWTVRYEPSAYTDTGTSTTIDPSAAYDNNILTDAIVNSTLWSVPTGGGPEYEYLTSVGNCIWSGFPKITISSAMTLSVAAAANISGASTASASIAAYIGSTPLAFSPSPDFTSTTAKATYTATVPSGTDLSTITVVGNAAVTGLPNGVVILNGSAQLDSFEIWIQ